ncbi:MAG: glycosyltransferase [Clostridia bacterium]|nr:glycosyltransferase [Clostridia bacterium]
MEKKLNILMLMDAYLPYVDGVVTCMHNYCLNLKEKGHNVVALVPNNKKYVFNEPYEIIPVKSFHVPFLNLNYPIHKYHRRLKEIIKEYNFDIIHVHSPFNAANYAIYIGKLFKIPVVATYHTDFKSIMKSIFKLNAIANSIVRNLGNKFNRMEEVFVSTPLLADYLKKDYGYKGKISYLNFGTNEKPVKDTSGLISKANERFGISSKETVFLTVGRVIKLKRIDMSLNALKVLKEKGYKFKFFIVGTGSDLMYFKKYAKRLGFSNEEIIFTGFLSEEDRMLIYARADMFLFPSLFDTFGLVKMEAACYKVPSVMIENSNSAFGTTDNVNAILSQDSTEDFANRIMHYINYKDELKEIGKNAQKDLYLNWSSATDELLEAYERIIIDYKQREHLS